MKKTFLVKRNSLLSSKSFSGGAVALVFVLLILLVRLFAPNFFLQMVTPVFRLSDAFAAEGHLFLSNFSNAAVLVASNEKLAEENNTLANENKTLEQKITNLEALLDVSGVQKNIPGILASVVMRPPVSPYDTLVLAKGTQDGVLLGSEAFGAGGAPIGVVSSVQDTFSRITLFTAPGTMTSGWIGRTSVPVTLFGTGAGTLQASVARAANITIGDTVFVPGPGQLPIGKVIRIDSDPRSPAVTLRIKLAINPFSLSWVVVRATGIVPLSFAPATLP